MPRLRRIRRTFFSIFVVSCGIAVFVAYKYHLGVPGTIISITMGGGAPAAAYLGWEGFVLTFRQDMESRAESKVVAKDADELAQSVKTQWSDEAIVRQFNEYSPLMVTWTAADQALSVGWQDLVRLASEGPGRPAPPQADTWAGDPGGLAGFDRELPAVLRRVPTGWLVVLGSPGAGKTMLMLRLVLDLLANREQGSGQPVPVFVPVTTWDPETDSLYSWLEDRLSIDHPGLAEYVSAGQAPQSRIAAMLALGKIIPILDGLDEMSPVARRKVIARLNEVLSLPDCPPQLLLTCRTAEYRETVGGYGRGWSPLRGAAAIELQPLNADHVEAYLSDNGRDPRWEPVVRELREPVGALSQALRTPLYVSLAATIYNPHPDDPAELGGSIPDPRELRAYPDARAIQDHLLDSFLPAAYRADPEQAEQSERQLGLLADYLSQNKESSLQWWTLHRLAPPGLVPAVVGVASAAVIFPAVIASQHVGIGIGIGGGTGLLVALVIAQAVRRATGAVISQPGPGMAGGLLGGVIGGLLAGVAAKAGIGHDPSMLSGLPEGLGMGIGAGASTSPAGGFAGALVGAFVGGLLEGVGLGVPAGIVNGLAIGLAVALAITYLGRRTPARWSPDWSPWAGITGGIVVGLAIGVVTWAEEGPVAGLAAGLAIGAAVSWPVGLSHREQKLSSIPSPGQALARDARAFRRAALAGVLAAGAAGFIGGGLTWISEVGGTPGLHEIVSNGLGAGLAYGLVIGLTYSITHAASPGFLIVSWWLALRGKTPWRLMRFLDDAYRRSILRQAGADYQFRHESLQYYLAARYRPASAAVPGLPAPDLQRRDR
jgi:hypothetical protein